jgi:hypothetical protein
MNDRGIPFLLVVYVGVLGTVALGAAYGYSNMTFEDAGNGARSQRETTILDQRLASAREIKHALRKPIPRPEPLTPIAAKPARALSEVAVAPEKPKHRSLSNEARDAFASGGDLSVASQPTPSRRDRHDVVSQ